MTTPPNVLFLLSDEHAFRYLSRLDPDGQGEPVRTPTLDDLAKSGAVFERAYCAMPLCLPSRLTMLTGREPRQCGAWGNPEHGNMTLAPDVPTLPETFADAGYETCLVGKMHLDGNRQFVGFHHRPYGDLLGGIGHQPDPPSPSLDGGYGPTANRIADAGVTRIPESALQEYNVVRETISFLREHRHANPDEPWFLCASLGRPHFPLTAPKRFFDRYWPDGVTPPKVGREGDTVDHPLTKRVFDQRRFDRIDSDDAQRARAAYFAAVDFLDEIVGDLLATLAREGLLDNTIVVYASDHGELAGEHGLWWKQTWHEAATRVPLSIQLPAHRRGDLSQSRIETPVSLIDLFPTLCELTGVDRPTGLDGTDLSTAIRTETDLDRAPVVCDNLNARWGEETEFRMVRSENYKFVRFRGVPDLLFDLESDPFERANLIDEATDDAELTSARERLAGLAGELDFEETAQRRATETRRRPDDELGLYTGTSGNAYHLPDGRIVDADTPLYKADVLVEDPSVVYEDAPGDET